MKLKNVLTTALAVGAVMVAGTASAQGVDVSAATAGFQGVADAVGDIGPLMLTAVGAGIVYKWVVAFLI